MTERRRMCNVRLKTAAITQIDQVAARNGQTRSDLLRKWISEGLQRDLNTRRT